MGYELSHLMHVNFITSIAGVIPMSHGVDDSLGHGLLGHFVFRRGLNTLFAGPDVPIDLGEEKINRVVCRLKDLAFVYLVGRDGLANRGAEMIAERTDCRGNAHRCRVSPRSFSRKKKSALRRRTKPYQHYFFCIATLSAVKLTILVMSYAIETVDVLSVAMTREEVGAVLSNMEGDKRLMTSLMYGMLVEQIT